MIALSYAVLAIVGVLTVAMWLLVLRQEYGRAFREGIDNDPRID